MKTVRDNVHGVIKLPPLAVRIINTDAFKRLKHLKQLGNGHEVFPTGNHTRFEHSIGVMHLASVAIEKLRERGVEISDADKLCVMIGGLCHDLGHGPFSHLWERFVKSVGVDWNHEKSSIEMLNFIIENEKIDISEYGLEGRDLEFIKEIIEGPLSREEGRYPYRGRGPEKYFLYELISNKITGIDVDKFDYFLRDSLATGLQVSFKYDHVLEKMKLVDWDLEDCGVSVKRIAFKENTVYDFEMMFSGRFKLHDTCYQHKVACKVDTMMLDAWLQADQQFPRTFGLKLSECVKDVRAHVTLTDDRVTEWIRLSDDPKLKQAKDILRRINKRDLYSQIAEITGNLEKSDQQIEEELGSNLAVARTVIDYGQKNKNPMTAILFYTDDGVFTKTDEELQCLAPKKIDYKKVHVFLRDNSPESKAEAVEKLHRLAEKNKGFNLKLVGK